MFRIDRYILREVGSPALLGVFLFLAVLLVNSFFQLAELAVQQGVPLSIIGRLILYLIPTLMTMTVPMAVLLGVLIGFSAMSARSELVAFKACGLSEARLLVPALLLGLMGTAASGYLYHILVPAFNQAHVELRLEIARSVDIGRTIKPRVFHEGLPGMVMYADDITDDGRTLKRLFLHREPAYPDRPEAETYVAPEATLERAEDGTVSIELRNGIQHRLGQNPADYDTVRFTRYRINQEPARPAVAGGSTSASKAPRQMNVPELREALERTDTYPSKEIRDKRRWHYQLEIHKRFALPVAALVFSFLAFPLGGSIRRGGRASGFAIALAIIMAYWIMIKYGEDRTLQGGMPPWLGMWLPNLAFTGLGLLLFFYAGSEGRRLPGSAWLGRVLDPAWQRMLQWATPLLRAVPRRRRAAARRLIQFRTGAAMILDRYVVSTYLRNLVRIIGGLYLIYLVGDYFMTRAKHVHENDVPMSVVLQYYKFMTPQIIQLVLPLSAMVAAVVAFGVLASSNEIRAMICSGVSIYRVLLPVVFVSLLLSVFSYALNEYILPFSNRRADMYDNIMEGRPPRSHYRPDRRWVFGDDGRLYHYLRLDEDKGRFTRLEVLDLDEDFRLERRTYATQGTWDGKGWNLLKGWTRAFPEEGRVEFEPFEERLFAWVEPPDYFSSTRKPPDEMRFGEYARYIEELADSGYETKGMKTELWSKVSFPSVTFVLVVIGLPFAFRMERKGALYGVGLAIALGMIYYVMIAAFAALGKAELLPPILAAFAPNILFLGAGLYLVLTVKT